MRILLLDLIAFQCRGPTAASKNISGLCDRQTPDGFLRTRHLRLGGLLNYYYRTAQRSPDNSAKSSGQYAPGVQSMKPQVRFRLLRSDCK
jgi:hypothetical protein